MIRARERGAVIAVDAGTGQGCLDSRLGRHSIVVVLDGPENDRYLSLPVKVFHVTSSAHYASDQEESTHCAWLNQNSFTLERGLTMTETIRTSTWAKVMATSNVVQTMSNVVLNLRPNEPCSDTIART